jgi:hypothetical protein
MSEFPFNPQTSANGVGLLLILEKANDRKPHLAKST